MRQTFMKPLPMLLADMVALCENFGCAISVRVDNSVELCKSYTNPKAVTCDSTFKHDTVLDLGLAPSSR
eukprot:3722372-Amphidinium_carterae.1